MVWASSQSVYVTIYFSFVSSSPHYLASFHLVTTSPCCFTHITMPPCHHVPLLLLHSYHHVTMSPCHTLSHRHPITLSLHHCPHPCPRLVLTLTLSSSLSSPCPCPHPHPHPILIIFSSSSSYSLSWTLYPSVKDARALLLYSNRPIFGVTWTGNTHGETIVLPSNGQSEDSQHWMSSSRKSVKDETSLIVKEIVNTRFNPYRRRARHRGWD